MNKVEKYKQLYPSENGLDDLILHQSGKVTVPNWLIRLLLDESGLKSKRKRIIKKVLKRQLQKLLQKHSE